MKLIWTQAIAVAMACGVAVMGAVAQENAIPVKAEPICPMRVHVFEPDARFDEDAELRKQAVILFARLSRDDFETAMQGMEPGEARDESARFKGPDARWRLQRPVDIPDDPDAFVILPTQVQYLVRMPRDSLIESLVLVGLPENGQVTRPALAGRLGAAAGEHAGQLFTAEPETEADRCPVVPGEVADWAQNLLRTQLTHHGRLDEGASQTDS